MCSLLLGLAFILSASVCRLSRRAGGAARRAGEGRLSQRALTPTLSRERERGKTLSEATGDVVLGLLLRRLREEDLGRAELDQLAEIHESREIRAARGLLHVVRHDCDGE